MITVKRAYDSVEAEDGIRFLVDRLWARGIEKGQIESGCLAQDVAPSTELRKWFGHDPTKWREFHSRFVSELKSNPNAWQSIVETERNGAVTLLYGAKDEAHNNAVVLRDFLRTRLAATR
jgi:uncharacterized protein YeaO (DUF488 family)